MKTNRRLAAPVLAVILLLGGCSPGPEARAIGVAGQSSDMAPPAIERYRAILATVKTSQQALAFETAKFSDANWLQVVKRSLDAADELRGRIEPLKQFDEVAVAAAALQVEVGRMQRELRRMDADTWPDVLPDLLLISEAIQSGMDELDDLAAPEPDEAPDHDHQLDGV